MASAVGLPAGVRVLCQSRPPDSEIGVSLQQSLSDSSARDAPAKSGVIVTTAASCASAVDATPGISPAYEPCVSQGQQCVLPFLCCAEVESSPQRPMSDSSQLDVAITPAKPGVVRKGESRCVPSASSACVTHSQGGRLVASLRVLQLRVPLVGKHTQSWSRYLRAPHA